MSESSDKSPTVHNTAVGLKKPAEFAQFVSWMALPEPLRNPSTQAELAVRIGVEPATLSDWRQRPGFWQEVQKELKSKLKEKTPEVMAGLFSKARSGTAHEVRLWLKYVDEWSDEVENRAAVQVNIFEDGNWERFCETFHRKQAAGVPPDSPAEDFQRAVDQEDK